MNLDTLLAEKEYTIYKLSKVTGIPKTTLFDIFSGKSNILDCRVGIVLKISKALDVDIEQLLSMAPKSYKPLYEENLPSFLKENIDYIKNIKNRKSGYFDCYLDEANSSINVCEVENLISKEQADYLRNRYLR